LETGYCEPVHRSGKPGVVVYVYCYSSIWSCICNDTTL